MTSLSMIGVIVTTGLPRGNSGFPSLVWKCASIDAPARKDAQMYFQVYVEPSQLQ